MISKAIKIARVKKGISQRELAREIGMSGQMISKIERGETTPSVTTIDKIAKALNVQIGDLLNENDLIKKWEDHLPKDSNEKIKEVLSQCFEIINRVGEGTDYSDKGGEILLPFFGKQFPDIDIPKNMETGEQLRYGTSAVLLRYLELTEKSFNPLSGYSFGVWKNSSNAKLDAFQEFYAQYKHDANEARDILDKMAAFIFEANYLIAADEGSD